MLSKRENLFSLLLLLLIAVGIQFLTFSKKEEQTDTRNKATKSLLKNLNRISKKGFLFGHQDDLAYGVEWRYEEGRSDIKEVVGDYPALYGWDIGGIEEGKDKNLDGVPFDKMRAFIQSTYKKGAVNTLSWHAISPLGEGKTAWDTTYGTVKSILPNETNHTLFKTWLDRVAEFISSLRDEKGDLIPIIFRPYHELTGHWFWWCKNTCTPDDFKAMWRFTKTYLEKEKGLNNLLWAYNTSGDFNAKEEYLERYPGDDVVDLLGFDSYQHDDPTVSNSFVEKINKGLQIVAAIAKEKKMPFALAETGYEAVPYPAWWTQTLLKAVGENKIAYVLVWRNHGLASWNNKMHYYAPYKGQVSEADFIRFYELPQTFFEKDIATETLYNE